MRLKTCFLSLIVILFSILSSCNEGVKDVVPESSLAYASIEELNAWMDNGIVTSEQLVNYYIARIDSIDKDNLNAVLVVNPDAVNQAKSLDEERKKGKVRSAMHGIPVLLKDNIDTGDKMPTTAGSVLLKDHSASDDAFIVKKLRAAGAVILGKTNLSEWANFRSTASSSGWSSLGGQTVNAFNQKKSPCGSSAGSGVAISAGLSTIAIGTETDGSIICPSAVNGIVGIKPTVGLWSRDGVIPISHTQDTPGPMANSVKDAATLLGICVGKDPKDSATSDQPTDVDYTSYCELGSLQGKRIGVDTQFMNIDGEMGKVFGQALEDLRAAGATIVPMPYRNALSGVGSSEYELLLYEFKDGMQKYLEGTNLPYKSLEDLLNANIERKEETMPIFGQEIFELAVVKGSLEDEAYKEAVMKSRDKVRFVIDSIFNIKNIDAIAAPALGPSWDIDHKNGDSFNGPSGYSPAAQSGYPSITVPMGMIDDLPVGIVFLGQKYEEGSLISIAYDYEQRTNRATRPSL